MKAKQLFVEKSDRAKIEIEKAAKRGEKLTHFFTSAKTDSNPVEAMLAYIANALIGNGDSIVTFNEPDRWGLLLFNMKSFRRETGVNFIFPFDFDLARLVQSPDDIPYVDLYLPDIRESYYAGQDKLIDEVKAYLLSRDKELQNAIDEADFSYRDITTGGLKVDESGRKSIRRYLNEAMVQIKKAL